MTDLQDDAERLVEDVTGESLGVSGDRSSSPRHPGRPSSSISQRATQLGLLVWMVAIVVLSGMTVAAGVASRVRVDAVSQARSVSHPFYRSITAVYQADLAFANATFGPPTARDFLVADLDRKIATTEAALAEVGGGQVQFAGRNQVQLARDEWTVVRTEMTLSLAAADDYARLRHAQRAFELVDSMAAKLIDGAETADTASTGLFVRADMVERRALWASLAVLVLGLGAASVLTRKFARDLTQPLEALRVGAGRLADGHVGSLVAANGPKEIAALAMSFNEMAESLRQRNATLTHRAYHDLLTGLGNQVALHLQVDAALAQLRRASTGQVALILLDLDDFKDINTTLGHSIGDRALEIVAGRIKATVRATDKVFRVNGDEFAILSEEASATIDMAAERIVNAISQPIDIEGHRVQLGVSVGIARAVTAAHSADELLSDAGLALKAAKAHVGNAVEYSEKSLREVATRRVDVARELRVAVNSEQFVVHYQPVINLNDGTLVGAEALVRWCHPTRGLLAPAEFIDVAESSELIILLGQQVLDIALRDCARWRRLLNTPADFKMWINVSAHQIASSSFVTDVEAAICRAGAQPDDVGLELTETAVLDRLSGIDSKLHARRALGVSVALDDFGTGYSSLSLIHTLPIEVIKIDRSFVTEIDQREQCRALVRAVIDIAAAHHHTVVVEGVETELEAAALRDLGATVAQGYLFGRAVPVDEFEQLWLPDHTDPDAEWTRLSSHCATT